MLDRPVAVRGEPAAQLDRRRHRVEVEVEGPYPRPEPVGREGEQPASASDVEEGAPGQVGDAQRTGQGLRGRLDPRLVDELDE
ncbi:MAG TPA: hypothetical protein VH912_17030 [Streptosporangiaceae bacterium]